MARNKKHPETEMPVEDHVYESAVRGRREMRQAYREARAARGDDRTLTAIHARADIRFLLACISDLEEAICNIASPITSATYFSARSDERVLIDAGLIIESDDDGAVPEITRLGLDVLEAIGVAKDSRT